MLIILGTLKGVFINTFLGNTINSVHLSTINILINVLSANQCRWKWVYKCVYLSPVKEWGSKWLARWPGNKWVSMWVVVSDNKCDLQPCWWGRCLRCTSVVVARDWLEFTYGIWVHATELWKKTTRPTPLGITHVTAWSMTTLIYRHASFAIRAQCRPTLGDTPGLWPSLPATGSQWNTNNRLLLKLWRSVKA